MLHNIENVVVISLRLNGENLALVSMIAGDVMVDVVDTLAGYTFDGLGPSRYSPVGIGFN